LQEVPTKYEDIPPIRLGGGENTFGSPFEIQQSESRYSRNVSSRLVPALSVRPGRADSGIEVTTPNILGQRNNEYIHVLDGTTWKRWDGSAFQTVQGTLTSATGKFVDFSTGTTRYTILANGTDMYSWDGTTATELTNAPASKLITVHRGRLYVARDNDIQYCALNEINDWSTVNNAGSVDVSRAYGVIIALTEFKDFVTAFTEFSMHVLYGTGPLNYNLVPLFSEDGCVSDKSVIECGGVLYWMDYNWIKAYSGAGLPDRISDKVSSYLQDINYTYKSKIAAGKSGKYIYWSIPYGATANNLILEYDTMLGTWYPHTGSIVEFVNIGNTLYGVDTDGKIWEMNSGTDDDGTAISWSYITGPWFYNTLRQKVLSNLWVSVDLPTGSTLTISSSETVDNDDFETLYTFTASSNEQNVRVQIPITSLQRVDWFRLQFAGTGPCTIHFVEPRLRVKR
jgi:hypothetical protein